MCVRVHTRVMDCTVFRNLRFRFSDFPNRKFGNGVFVLAALEASIRSIISGACFRKWSGTSDVGIRSLPCRYTETERIELASLNFRVGTRTSRSVFGATSFSCPSSPAGLETAPRLLFNFSLSFQHGCSSSDACHWSHPADPAELKAPPRLHCAFYESSLRISAS